MRVREGDGREPRDGKYEEEREREWKEGERFNRRKIEEGEQSNAGY